MASLSHINPKKYSDKLYNKKTSEHYNVELRQEILVKEISSELGISKGAFVNEAIRIIADMITKQGVRTEAIINLTERTTRLTIMNDGKVHDELRF